MQKIEKSIQFIRTPIDILNIIGAGGIKEGTISEIYGLNRSGKSAFAYDTLAMFLKDNVNAFVTIIDHEKSVDYYRMVHTFDLDLSRTYLENQDPTLEGGFEAIGQVIRNIENQKKAKIFLDQSKDNPKEWDTERCRKEAKSIIVNKKELIPDIDSKEKDELLKDLEYVGHIAPSKNKLSRHILLWDTIAVAEPRTEAEHFFTEGEAKLNSGGMNLKTRVIKKHISLVLARLFDKPLTLLILNQGTTSGFGEYTGTYTTSSGGNALKHAHHYRFFFEFAKKEFDENLNMNVGTYSRVSIEKSKFGPSIKDVQIYIDDLVGGKITPKSEIANVAYDAGYLVSSGGWWRLKVPEELKSVIPDYSYRWDNNGKDRYIVGNSEVREYCKLLMMYHFKKHYMLLNEAYKDLEENNISLVNLPSSNVEEVLTESPSS